MYISIAICTYNGEKYLEKQLNSFLQQTRLPDEIIICDDGSKDRTLSILEKFKNNAPFKVIINRSKVNLGVIRNFEKAIGLCSGDVVFLSDQDDIWRKDKVEVYLDFFKNHPGSLMVFSNGELINEFDKPTGLTLWDKWNFNTEIRKQWLDNEKAFAFLIRSDNKITGATAAIRSDLKKHIFPFTVPKGMWHDAWLGIYASKYNGLYYLEESFIQYRVHEDQLVGIGSGKAIFKKKSVFRELLATIKNNILK